MAITPIERTNVGKIVFEQLPDISQPERKECAHMEKKKWETIPLGNVKIKDNFWSPIQNLMIDKVIPYQEEILNDKVPGVEKSHAISNFKIAAGMEEGEFYGMVFQDSDVAKWLEGVADSLAVKPDADLERRADEVIEIIEKAQQEDGYLNTYFTIKEPEHRWQNLQECHELYCAGHMMEAAAAYYETTGKDRLLRVMMRMADHIEEKFEKELEHGIPGHQEIEIGLMKLYHVTGEEKYLRRALSFIEERGKNPDYFVEESKKRGWVHFGADPEDREYNQVHATVYEQDKAVGHSVRAVYMYTAMADLAGTLGNEKLYGACEKLWDNMTKQRMYLTGGIGSTAEGEAFTVDYHLPADSIYAETCASIGLIFFARQMLEAKPKGIYADVMERAFYNGTISGMQLDGTKFFYVNPLEVNPGVSGNVPGYRHVLPQRPGWYRCACCPPNLVRLVTSLGKYVWTEKEDIIYSHMLMGQEAELRKARVRAESEYPWNGRITYHIEARTEEAFTMAFFIPFHARNLAILLNGEEVNGQGIWKEGYWHLTKQWGKEEKLEIRFDMPVRRIYANQKVRDCAGCVALMRGPVVYCFEEADNGGGLQSLRVAKSLEEEIDTCQDGVLKGKYLLKVNGYRCTGGEDLYTEERPHMEKTRLTAVPYYAWGNRGIGQMRVWMLEDGD